MLNVEMTSQTNSQMSPSQVQLYQRLQNFELDDPTDEFGFTRHLIKNHGWTATYAARAIAEYKKFAFLTVVADHQVVPSDTVDQVWHAHVLLTQSYWEEFCPRVLGQPLHHHPARGGHAERAEFHQLYAKTIQSYRKYFCQPPSDIWSPAYRRFGAELKMQRINRADNWVIPKRLPRLQERSPLPIVLGVAIALITVGCTDLNQSLKLDNILNATLFVDSIGVAIILGLVVRYWITQPRQQPQVPDLDDYEIAYLFGGSNRVTELAIVQLVQQGYLRPNVHHRSLSIKKKLPNTAPEIERQVMQQVHRTPELKELRKSSSSNVYRLIQREQVLIQQLRQKQILMAAGWTTFLANSLIFLIFANLLLAFLLLFLSWLVNTVFSQQVELQQLMDSQLWKISQTLAVTFTLFCYVPSGLTRWGDRVKDHLRQHQDPHNLTQSFALHGAKVLSGGALEDLKQIFLQVAEEEAAANSCGCGC